MKTPIESRRSVRAFLDTPVEDQQIESILTQAARAPSSTNMQPWQVYVVQGETRAQLCDAACDAFDNESAIHDSEARYYPKQWFEPFLSRRRKVGWDLYTLLEIEKGDKAKMHRQHRRNFQFFDAPVGLIFTAKPWPDGWIFITHSNPMDHYRIGILMEFLGHWKRLGLKLGKRNPGLDQR